MFDRETPPSNNGFPSENGGIDDDPVHQVFTCHDSSVKPRIVSNKSDAACAGNARACCVRVHAKRKVGRPQRSYSPIVSRRQQDLKTETSACVLGSIAAAFVDLHHDRAAELLPLLLNQAGPAVRVPGPSSP